MRRAALLVSIAPIALAACSRADAPSEPGSPVATAAPPAPPSAPPGPPPVAPPADAQPVPLPAVPLHTDGRWIVDANGKRFKLAAVNWYGAEEKDFVVAGLDRQDAFAIAKEIRAAGFDAVRLPWSNELVEANPLVAPELLAANPKLVGKRALEVLDAVVEAIAHEGLVVILDDHTSRADWCCNETDGNGLWFTDGYPESAWLADWHTMARRYAAQPAVVGADLRNELRGMPDGRKPTWGGADPTLDWRAAARRGADAVLAENPSLLVFVEGLEYATNLTGVYSNPLTLSVPNRLVYSAHDYSWFHVGMTTYDDLKTNLGDRWGYVLTQDKPFTAPIWVGELGTSHDAAGTSSAWFAGIQRYLSEADIDWAYWALNGTQATGASRTWGAEETFGFLDKTWSAPADATLAAALSALAPATQGPR